MSKRTRLYLLAAVVSPVFALSAQPATAALMHWDVNGTTPGASGGATATGAWNNTATNWNTDSTGGAGGAVAAWTSSADTAIFSAGANATGTSTVTASGTPVAAGIILEEGTISLAGRVDVNTGTVELKGGTKLFQASSGGATGTGITLTSGGKYLISGNATLRQTNASTAGSFVSSVGTIQLANNAILTAEYTTNNSLSIIQTATVISGSGSLVKGGTGVIAIASPSTYNGTTTINDGELRIRTGANRLPIGTAVTVNSPGILNLNSVVAAGTVGQQIGSLSGNGSVGLGTNILSVTGSTSTVFSGVIADIANDGASGTTGVGGGLTKAGSSILTLSGINTFTGPTRINAGAILAASLAGQALSGTSRVEVNGATSSLILGDSNEVKDTAKLLLNGGKFDTAGLDEVLGTLELASNSTVDMGSLDSVVAHANSSAETWAGTVLNVHNWTGTPNVGGGLDQLIFGSDATGLTPAQLGKIVFYSDAGTTQIIGNTIILGNGEVVPFVPEPGSLTLLCLSAVGLLGRRRRRLA